jgi:FAD:protein FMN transferase
MHYTEKRFDGNKRLLYAWFQAMHTRIDLMVYVINNETNLTHLAQNIEEEINRIETFANRFDEKSELALVNRNAYTNAVEVSDELLASLSQCQQFHQQSAGYFDITVNSLNHLTNGMNYIELDKEAKSVKFRHPDVLIDLSGYIKGYALGKVVDRLKATGVENALVNVGNSSIYALGNHPFGEGWKISTGEKETTNERSMKNECLSTSGYSENRKWPVKNPITGITIGEGRQVSVLTSEPVVGEVVSKIACLAMGEELENLLKQFDAQII